MDHKYSKDKDECHDVLSQGHVRWSSIHRNIIKSDLATHESYSCGPGSALCCSGPSFLGISICFHLRYTLATARVQKGTRSAPGTSLAKNVGRNSQCQPSR